MPKHEGHETVASLDSQNLQMGASDEVAAPQLGQLSVWASIAAFRWPKWAQAILHDHSREGLLGKQSELINPELY